MPFVYNDSIIIYSEYHLPPEAFSSLFIIAAPTPSFEVVVANITVAVVLSHALSALYKAAPISSLLPASPMEK